MHVEIHTAFPPYHYHKNPHMLMLHVVAPPRLYCCVVCVRLTVPTLNNVTLYHINIKTMINFSFFIRVKKLKNLPYIAILE